MDDAFGCFSTLGAHRSSRTYERPRSGKSRAITQFQLAIFFARSSGSTSLLASLGGGPKPLDRAKIQSSIFGVATFTTSVIKRGEAISVDVWNMPLTESPYWPTWYGLRKHISFWPAWSPHPGPCGPPPGAQNRSASPVKGSTISWYAPTFDANTNLKSMSSSSSFGKS
eukprot:1179465-Prorocentrum_minimum.AAC.3